MKKLLFATCIGIYSPFAFAQELERNYKVELGFQGISVGAELPVGNKFLADVQLGWGGVTDFNGNGIAYEWSSRSRSAFLKGQMRYYLNRERRATKGRSLRHNAGTFLAFQTKYYFNGVEDYQIGKYWLNELQFGQQLPMGNHFFYRYHVGIGYANDLDYNYTTFYPAIGLGFGFSF